MPPTPTCPLEISIQRLMDHRSRAMVAGYVSGQYPIPLAKRAWAAALINGLIASGEVPRDHKGTLQIRLVFRGDSRAPDVKLEAMTPLDN